MDNFSTDWPESNRFEEIIEWIKLKGWRKVGKINERNSCNKLKTWGRPWSKTPRTQRANLSLPLSKAHPILGSTERIWKASEVSSCPPTDATMREQLFELESVLSESSHVCPTDWMSCIREGFETLFSTTFKVFSFSESHPYVTKVPVKPWW